MTYISSVFILNTQFIIFLNEVYKQTNHAKIANIILLYFRKQMSLIQLKHAQI